MILKSLQGHFPSVKNLWTSQHLLGTILWEEHIWLILWTSPRAVNIHWIFPSVAKSRVWPLVSYSSIKHMSHKLLKLWQTREIPPLWNYRWVSALQISCCSPTPCLTCQDGAFSSWIFLFDWSVVMECLKPNAAMRSDTSGDKSQVMASLVRGLQVRWSQWFEIQTATVSPGNQVKSSSKSKTQLNRCALR